MLAPRSSFRSILMAFSALSLCTEAVMLQLQALKGAEKGLRANLGVARIVSCERWLTSEDNPRPGLIVRHAMLLNSGHAGWTHFERTSAHQGAHQATLPNVQRVASSARCRIFKRAARLGGKCHRQQ